MAIKYGETYLFGLLDEIPPILNMPRGRVKIKVRMDDFVKLYARDEEGVKAYMLKGNEDYCYAYPVDGRNIHIK